MGDVAKREIDKIRERGSLDRIIDNALIHYEEQSLEKKEDEAAMLEEQLFYASLMPLFEADEPASDDDKGGESTLNPEEFAANVAMLCSNHERLLNIELAISNRAYLYVLKNYDRQMADRFRAILSSKFRIHLDPKDKPTPGEFIGLVGKAGGGA